MACFIVPAVEAVVTTIATKVVKSKETKSENLEISLDSKDIESVETSKKIPFSHKLGWLNNLLWGGSGLLAFEHLWHGEVVPWFPFLTAAGNPTDAAEMLHEMSTVGVGMAGLVTAVWLGMVAVSSAIEKKADSLEEQSDDSLEEA
ncbi:MAG: hypothetical protein IJ224_03525 [Lachnospiraceae bacterium]|nr:hypothetical protein [Lachnospiraceae bacterium]